MQGACEEPNQALLCYRRVDADFAKALVKRLKSFEIDCFRDEEAHKYGEEWRPCWRQQLNLPVDPLAPEIGPTVVVLATEVDLQDKPLEDDVVVKEIWEALTPIDPGWRNPIVVLQFGTAGWRELKRRLQAKAEQEGRPNVVEKLLGGLHQPRPFDAGLLRPDLTDQQWNEVCAPIVGRVHSYFLRKLHKERAATRSWAAQILARRLSGAGDSDVFSRQASRLRLDAAIGDLARLSGKRAVVAVGAGGLGKTTQVAQSLHTLLETLDELPFFPIVLSLDDLANLDATLRSRLGLTWLAEGRSVSLPDEGLQWFADKICFITDSLERAGDVETTARQLERLRAVAKLLVTSRPEAWSKAKEILLVDKSDVTPLDVVDVTEVQNYLGIARPEDVTSRPYLRNPVFLDIAAHLGRAGHIAFEGSLLSSETQLLDAFKAFSIKPRTGRPPTEMEAARRASARLLERLARAQIDANRFDVSWSALREEGHADAMDDLVQERNYAIVDGVADDAKRIRLRHDVIDAHNIANLVQDDPDIFRQLLGSPGALSNGKLHLGFGELVFEGIVQAAYDREQRQLVETFFLEFLRLVDNKAHPSLKAAGWNAGYVVTARFRAFADLVKTALAGSYLGEEVPRNPAERSSGLDKLTQNAMSSVASMLGGQDPLSIDDADGSLLRSLMSHIRAIKLRGRLIEGVAKIDRPDDVVARLCDLAADAALLRDDPGLARYIARALADTARGAPPSYGHRILSALKQLHDTFSSELGGRLPTILRDIERARHDVAELTGLPRIRETPLTPDEVIEGLLNVDPATRVASGGLRLQFSDWMIVERYLSEVGDMGGRIGGEIRDDVVLAVARSLWHFHLRCREQAARTLGYIDHPLARGMLLHLLTFETDDGVERVLIDALDRHSRLLRKHAPERAYRFRLALVRVIAQRQRLVGAQRTGEFAELVASFDTARSSLVTEHFIELRRFAAGAPEMLEDATIAPPDLPEWLTHEERHRDVGEEKEAKIAFLPSRGASDGTLRFIGSSWQMPRRLHVALERRGDFFRRLASRCGRPADLPPIWRAQNDHAIDNHRATVTAHFMPPWDDWKDRDEPAFAEYVEAIARRYALFEVAHGVPTIAAVHAVVVLADGHVLEGMRCPTATYAPGAWAASFEEQMQRRDASRSDGIRICLARGLSEEFGLELAPDAIAIGTVSLGVEWEIFNTVALVVARLSLSSGEVLDRWAAGVSDGELATKRTLPLETRLETVARSPIGYWVDTASGQQHPTSGARLALIDDTPPK